MRDDSEELKKTFIKILYNINISVLINISILMYNNIYKNIFS